MGRENTPTLSLQRNGIIIITGADVFGRHSLYNMTYPNSLQKICINMMPRVEAVAIQHISKLIDTQKNFTPNDHHVNSGITLLNELHKWALALKTIRA
jgi:hypothetical protein